jgi:hypothetical protein
MKQRGAGTSRGRASRPRRRAAALAAALGAALAAGGAVAASEDAVTEMVRRLLDAPEATASVVLERSDPFGGPPEREEGRVWYLPGRGLRYRAEGKVKHEIAIDRAADRVILYRPSEPHVYEATWAKAPMRLRQLVADPERVLRGTERAEAESRTVRGRRLDGWRLRGGSLGDSLGRGTVWVTRDDAGLPRYVSVANDVDTLLVEFRGWSLRREARPRDLVVNVPRGTPASPLDPRDLLGGVGTAETR